jgi:23S rRNA pseudouridine1911/1915/1917 synthase
MKKVPFYANHEDNMHCMLAAYRSVIDYFLKREASWEELEKLSGYSPGRAAWTVQALVGMLDMGFNIRMIEPFDYQRYMKEGESYLKTRYSDEELQWYYKYSNIREIRPLIPPFLKRVDSECRIATLRDIDDMLDDGRLVFVTVNSRKLNGKEGFASHALLVTDRQGDAYIAHDSGGKTAQPQPNREISRQQLQEAMGGKNNTAEVTGFKLGTSMKNKRLDVYVSEQLPLSRAFSAKLIADGKVTVNGRIVLKPGHKLHMDDQVVTDYDVSQLDNIPSIDLPILLENNDVLAISKPAGVLTHAAGGFNTEASVATFMRSYLADDLTGARAGIVHRLDRPTSGVLIAAKNARTLSFLQKQFAHRSVQKTYIAIVQGHLPEKEAVIDMPIDRNPKAPATFRVGVNGKAARTRYKVLQENKHASLVELKPETGRTHQLRVHLAHIGHPIVGDPLYGDGKHGDRLYLHAKSLQITLPYETEPRTFTAPLPPEFNNYMESA